jgi:hypothetical protein
MGSVDKSMTFQEVGTDEECWIGMASVGTTFTLSISRKLDGDIHAAMDREQVAQLIALLADCLASA